MVTLITMGAGNVEALGKTLESFKGLCDEVVYGDLLLFDEDRKRLGDYKEKYNLKSIRFDFNLIFEEGFSALLNRLAALATNRWVIYMNTGEVIDSVVPSVEKSKVKELILDKGLFSNTFYFDHATDPHKWFRLYDRTELKWSGRIHEELRHKNKSLEDSINPHNDEPAFRMKDLEKDLNDPYKAWVFNDVKEIVYFEQYRRIVENPSLLEGTNEYWLWHARENYLSFVERLEAKKDRYEAFKKRDLVMYFANVPKEIKSATQGFSTSKSVEFQGDKQTLL